MTSMVAGRMAEAAAMLIESLDQAQRRIACRPFPDQDERRSWYYTPTDHGGLPLADMGGVQRRNVHRLVASGLSTPGYVTVAVIMGLEDILDQVEGWSVDFGRERGRDPLLYYITIFGEPGGDAPWGWRFGGHHVSLNRSPSRRTSAASCSGRSTRKSARGRWCRRSRPPIWSAATVRTSRSATGRRR
jgi:hypothetical protein